MQEMKTLLWVGLLLASVNADIGLKLREEAERRRQQNGRLQAGSDTGVNLFYIPSEDKGGLGAAAQTFEQREIGELAAPAKTINRQGKEERSHTLEELCNDAFHSFLCKPVGGKRRRIDGNLRPGAVLPPGIRVTASSNTRENKVLPSLQLPSNDSPNFLKPSKISDNQVPAAQSEQGYFYPKPSNALEVNKPLRNGYLPPDNRFTTPATTPRRPPITTPRPLQTFTVPSTTSRRYFSTTPRPLQTFTIPSTTPRRPTTSSRPFQTFPTTTSKPFQTFPTTTRRPFTTRPPIRQPVPNNFDVKYQTTQRPTTLFTPSRTNITPKLETFTPRQPSLNSYLPPSRPTNTKAPFFSQSSSNSIFTTRTTPSRPPPPPPTLPPIRLTTTTSRPFTQPPRKVFTTQKYQTSPNTYLPPFAEQKLNPLYISTTSKPTFRTTTVNKITTNSRIKAPANTYLPPDNPPIDIRFGSASNTRESGVFKPEAAQNPSVTVKPDEEHNLERLCNDPFHSFLCQPITKPRYVFDGRLRPQAVIPQGVLLTSNTFNNPIKVLSEMQAGSNIQPSISSETGYIYSNPSTIQQSAQTLLDSVFPTISQPLGAANENSINSGYLYPSPSNGLLSVTSSQTGYVYQKPVNNEFNFKSSTGSPKPSSIAQTYTSSSTTIKPYIQSNQFLQSNLLASQNSNNQPFLVASTEKSQDKTGYNYPKPINDKQFLLPSSTPIPGTFAPRTETRYVYSTTTPRPSQAFETSTSGGFKIQSTGPQFTGFFTGYETSNPTNTQGVSIFTTEKPTTNFFDYQNQVSEQVFPETFQYQKPSNGIGDFNGYSYPKPNVPLQQQATINTVSGYSYPVPDVTLQQQSTVNSDNGYFYPKPSLSFQDNRPNSFFSPQLKTSLPVSPKGNSYSFAPLPSPQSADPKTAKNINQLLGPSSDSTSRDLPPASQFEILKVRKRQNS